MQLILLAAAVAQTFNLACSGTMTSSDITGRKTEPYSYVYRLNLDTKQYCDGECKAPHPITAIQPTALILSETQTDTAYDVSTTSNQIDRETGRHHILYTHKNPRSRLDTSLMEWEGHCERQPFTGFPSFETKF